MQRPSALMKYGIAFAATLACSGSLHALDLVVTRGPPRDAPQLYTTPEQSATPGMTFFYRARDAGDNGDGRFAADMYRVSASWAYKPAQYNLGVMYFTGDGVPVDKPLGMAWLALAAERDEKKFVSARDSAYLEMDAAEFERANELWRAMRKDYGDAVALKRAKNRWLQVRRAATGGHLGSGTSAVSMGDITTLRANLIGGTKSGTSFGLTGAGSSAASGYKRLRDTDNPYDELLKRPVPEVRVDDIIPIGDGIEAARAGQSPAKFY